MSYHSLPDTKKLSKYHLYRFRALSKRVSSRYKNIGKELGLKAIQLSDTALRGAAFGYLEHYQHKSRTWKRKNKVSVYVLWWMRRFVHIMVVKRFLDMGKTNRSKAEQLLLELLED